LTRELLPQRRHSENFDFQTLGTRFSCQVGYYADGRIGEVFLGMEKAAGTQTDVNARDIAVLISICLQYGVKIEKMLATVTKDENGDPEGLTGKVLKRLSEMPAVPLET